MATGRSRRPTKAEAAALSTLLLPNAVVEVMAPVELHSDAEHAVASAIDGWRPIARVRVRSGLRPRPFREALAALAERGALRVVAIIEERDELTGLADLSPQLEDVTVPRGDQAAIPASVMAEIDEMLREEERRSNEDAFEESTDVTLRLTRARRRT